MHPSKLVALTSAFKGKRVLVTGHTGFKGSWLTLFLQRLGAEVIGFSLPPKSPSMFQSCALGDKVTSHFSDLRKGDDVISFVDAIRPDVIFHLGAQALVLESYNDPVGTFSTNVMGTVNILEAVRLLGRPCTVIVVTSDKCYENEGRQSELVETDPLGGYDPYSASKGAAELIVSAYRRSFFNPVAKDQQISLASVRAGNVIGGGDWGKDRLVPDLIQSLQAHNKAFVRNPFAVRPWQFVLDPLSGYLQLVARLIVSPGNIARCSAFNFGPSEDPISVSELADKLVQYWGEGSWAITGKQGTLHEAEHLRLNCAKAKALLGWSQSIGISEAVEKTVSWYKENAKGANMYDMSLAQIEEFIGLKKRD